MLLRERQRKHSISLALAAILIVMSQNATDAANDKTANAQIGLTAQAKPIKTVAAVAPKPATKVTKSAAARYKELNNPKEAPEKTKSKPKRSSTQLVPPPPPTIPTYLNVPQGSAFDLGFQVQTLSLDDLKFHLKNVEKKLSDAKLDERDQKNDTEEKEARAKRFVELFDEGVVSRKELETSKQEAERSVRDLEQSHIKVSELDRVLVQVKERIQSLEALKKPVRVSSKAKKSKSK